MTSESRSTDRAAYCASRTFTSLRCNVPRKSPVGQPFFLERFGAAYLAEMRYFVDTVSAGKLPRTDAGDGLKAQLIADAATLSWHRRQPVDIAGCSTRPA
ncbi:Gfo/Idh/MocA family oxidoreductase [Burkholderia sp. MSMB1078WGS]|uniref:Gfo/Idh/MocA family oxidoreductase n=1 Tax=Burkholderia sp. MSMB1078WGS TaxID=1637900 RepID=UPI00359CA3CC